MVSTAEVEWEEAGNLPGGCQASRTAEDFSWKAEGTLSEVLQEAVNAQTLPDKTHGRWVRGVAGQPLWEAGEGPR